MSPQQFHPKKTFTNSEARAGWVAAQINSEQGFRMVVGIFTPTTPFETLQMEWQASPQFEVHDMNQRRGYEPAVMPLSDCQLQIARRGFRTALHAIGLPHAIGNARACSERQLSSGHAVSWAIKSSSSGRTPGCGDRGRCQPARSCRHLRRCRRWRSWDD